MTAESVTKERPLLIVRSRKSRTSNDGTTEVYVPLGMTGSVMNVVRGRPTVYWDAAFVCDYAQRPEDPDPDRGVSASSWEECDVDPEELEFIRLDAPEVPAPTPKATCGRLMTLGDLRALTRDVADNTPVALRVANFPHVDLLQEIDVIPADHANSRAAAVLLTMDPRSTFVNCVERWKQVRSP